MRLAFRLLCLSLVFAGCVRKPAEPAPVTQSLVIEVREHGGAYALFLNDEQTPTTTEALLASLEEYARVVDPTAGLSGRDSNLHRSDNPVVFRAPLQAPAELFYEVAELFVHAHTENVWVEMTREGRVSRRCAVELPRDSSLEWYSLDDWLSVAISLQDDTAELSVSRQTRDRSRVRAQFVPLPFSAESFSDAVFNKRQRALTGQLLAADPDAELYDVYVVPDPADRGLPWGLLFQALDAVAVANQSRRDSGGRILWYWGPKVSRVVEPPPESPPSPLDFLKPPPVPPDPPVEAE